MESDDNRPLAASSLGEHHAVGRNGGFLWRHPLRAGDKLTVKFNIRGVVSSPVTL